MKRRMKRVFVSVLATLVLMATFAISPAVATGTPTFSISEASGQAGEQVQVSVRIADNPGIIALQVRVSYDSEVLELQSADGQGDFSGVAFGPLNRQPFNVSWDDSLNPNSTANGTLATLTFQIKADAAPGDTVISIAYDEDNVFNSDYDNVSFATQNGKVTVTEPPSSNVSVYSTNEDCSAAVGRVSMSSEAGTTTVSASTISGYRFLGWYVVTGIENGQVTAYGEQVATTLSHTFTPTEDTALVAVYQARNSVNVTIGVVNGAQYSVGNSATVRMGGVESVPLGSNLLLSAVDSAKVLQWQDENGMILGTDANLSFPVNSRSSLMLVYRSELADQAFVQFVSSYDQVLSYNQYSATDEILFPTAPTRFGYTFDKWVFEGTDTEATEESIRAQIASSNLITLRPSYTKNEGTLIVTVEYAGVNRAADQYSLAVGSTRTLQAPEIDGYTFQCWKKGSTVLSYRGDYYIQPGRDTTLTACYVTSGTQVQRVPVIAMTDLITEINEANHLITCFATRSIPDGYTLLEQGVLYGINLESLTAETFVPGASGVYSYKGSTEYRNGVQRLSNRVSSDTIVIYHRGYMIVRDESTGEEAYYYTDIVSGSYNSINQ